MVGLKRGDVNFNVT